MTTDRARRPGPWRAIARPDAPARAQRRRTRGSDGHRSSTPGMARARNRTTARCSNVRRTRSRSRWRHGASMGPPGAQVAWPAAS